MKIMNKSVDYEYTRFKGHSIFGKGKRSTLIRSETHSISYETNPRSIYSITMTSNSEDTDYYIPSLSDVGDEDIIDEIDWLNENYY